jgi:hypothetical protein
VFSFPFYPKNFRFWPIILQNGTKHHAKIFWQKGIHSPFWILASRDKKKPKNPHPPVKNLTFWMELNTPMKILAFCISSFQSSWHFTFCISWEIKHSLTETMNSKLGRPFVLS